MRQRWTRWSCAATMLLVLALAAAMRLPRLAERPMHADEANQAVKAGLLYEKGQYEYDNTDHHGPSLYWLTLPALSAAGANGLADSREAAYRIVPVLFALGLFPLLLLLGDGLGRLSVVTAGILLAISPAMVFYSRYYIHETLLLFFTLAAIGCGWRYCRSGRLAWMLAAGGTVGMMHATKETWVLSAVAAVISVGITRAAVGRRSAAAGEENCHRRRLAVHFAAGAAVACLAAVVFFSMFGRNWQAPLDSILAYANYLRRGSLNPDHVNPWYFYLQVLFAFRPSKHFFWSEGLIAVLALVGAAASLADCFRSQARRAAEGPADELADPPPTLSVFLTCFTLLLTLFYCLIPYKTPWCVLSFLLGMILLAGYGASAILRRLPNWPLRTLAASALIAGAVHLGWQAYRLSFDPRLFADPRNPYIYAHTPPPLLKLARQLDRLADRTPGGRELWIQIAVQENYWPLPWYLRKFDRERICCWPDAAQWRSEASRFPQPAVVILSAEFDGDEATARLAGYGGPSSYSLRPGILIRVYVRSDLWPDFLAAGRE